MKALQDSFRLEIAKDSTADDNIQFTGTHFLFPDFDIFNTDLANFLAPLSFLGDS